MEKKVFFQYEIIINVLLALSDSFEYTYVMGLRPLYFFLLFKRQILTSKVDPRAVRAKGVL